ncbi:MAG TPA: GAF domain-containing protein [Crinalium sp.]|jgi:GAF domain-containing protein
MMQDLSLEQIAQQAQTLVQAETAVVALAESEGETVYYAAAVGKHAAAIAGKRGDSATSGLCGTTFQEGQPVLVCQTRGDARVRQDYVEALGIETALAVPIYYNGQLLGALMMLNRQDGRLFDTEAEQQLATFASAIAPQIQQWISKLK